MLCNTPHETMCDADFGENLKFLPNAIASYTVSGTCVPARGLKTNSTTNVVCSLFFGLVKQFDVVLPTIRRHIVNVNPKCTVFVHTYNIQTVTNPRNKEYEALLSPQDALKLSSNVMFENTTNVNVIKYRPYFPRHRGWSCPTSMDNMILQWNSISRVASWAFDVHNYTRVGFFRLDVVYRTDIDISRGDATIPGFLSSGGYNDRMFYGTAEYAQVWATRFSKVKKYMQTHTELHSEHFVKYILQSGRVPVRIDKTICFHRIRATNQTQKDCADGSDVPSSKTTPHFRLANILDAASSNHMLNCRSSELLKTRRIRFL